MDAHRGIAVRRGCRWTGCRGAPGLGASLAAGSLHRTGPPARPVQQHPQPLFHPKARLPHPWRGRVVPAWRSRFPAAHTGQGAAVGLVGVRATVCPLRAPSVPAPCPPCGSGSGTHACGQGAAARRPSPSACPGCGAVRNASCRAAEQDRGP